MTQILTTLRQLKESTIQLIERMNLLAELILPLGKILKGVNVTAAKSELMEQLLNEKTAATDARKARKTQAKNVLQIGGVLYAKQARTITKERLEKEKKWQRERDDAFEKRYLAALSKAFRSTKKGRKQRMDRMSANDKQWRIIMRELLNSTPMYIE